MNCRKCRQEIPDGSRYCMFCGALQEVSCNTKARGNGTGSVFKRGKTWTACRVIGYTTEIIEVDGQQKKKLHKTTRSKGGFKTKKEALEYLPKLTEAAGKKSLTWAQLYAAWKPTHRAGKSTMDCYSAAEKHFKPVWHLPFDRVDVDDLQECLDDCPKGKRTRENMKALAGLLYKYAIPRHIVTLNIAQYLTVGAGDTGERSALPEEALEALREAVGAVQGADYILAQCYLGFRPSELLALNVRDYNRRERAFTVSPKIQPIIDRLTRDKISGPVFCAPDGGAMTIEQYRALFYRALDECGIENPVEGPEGAKRHRYTPHSCRHTFATLMKRVDGADKDKLELIGHTSNEMLRHYQDVSLEDLRRVTDAL